MKVQVRNENSTTIIECTGEVDLYTSPKLREALLKEMVGIKTNVLLTQTRFGLYGLRPNARSVLELARLTKVFIIFEDEQEALAKIGTTLPFSGLA